MKRVILLLSLTLFICSCSSNTKIKVIKVFPPVSYLSKCKIPFNKPPKTYGEAVYRDAIWYAEFSKCKYKIKKIKEWVNRDNKETKNY